MHWIEVGGRKMSAFWKRGRRMKLVKFLREWWRQGEWGGVYACMCVCVCAHVCVCMSVWYIYIYIYIERERERGKLRSHRAMFTQGVKDGIIWTLRTVGARQPLINANSCKIRGYCTHSYICGWGGGLYIVKKKSALNCESFSRDRAHELKIGLWVIY